MKTVPEFISIWLGNIFKIGILSGGDERHSIVFDAQLRIYRIIYPECNAKSLLIQFSENVSRIFCCPGCCYILQFLLLNKIIEFENQVLVLLPDIKSNEEFLVEQDFLKLSPDTIAITENKPEYLQEKLNAQVITVTVDVGQQEDIKAAGEKAKKLEAVA